MTRGIVHLVAAQFVSGLADNALLIVAIARLAQQGDAPWIAPLLKGGFTLAYVVLAPLVGAWADRWPKARVMLAANALKAAACAAMLAGLDPLLAYGVAGVGAALYSPAKYGLVVELAAPGELVRANGLLELTTVAAVVLGTMLGGALVAGGAVAMALAVVLALYLAAGGLNRAIPCVAPSARKPPRPALLLAHFGRALRILWRDGPGGASLAVTTLFWGTGATLQFVVLAWAQGRLALTLSQAAYLQGVVAVGIALGALAAGRWLRLEQATRVLPLGIVMGLGVPLLTLVRDAAWAALLLAGVGALAGFFVVPMNALLQQRGHRLLGSGRSIAVQNFCENLAVLAMLAGYAGLQAGGWPLERCVLALGAVVVAGVLLTMIRLRSQAGRRIRLTEERA